MKTQWEYLKLVWSRRVEEKKSEPAPWDEADPWLGLSPGASTSPEGSKSKWHRFDTFEIWRPGATEAKKIEGWAEGEEVSGPPLSLRLLNELGAEGWELVDKSIGSHAAGKNRLGWNTASWPVEIIWTMKRPISA